MATARSSPSIISTASIISSTLQNSFHQRAETFGLYLEKHFRMDARQQGDRRIAGPQNDGNDGLVCRAGNSAAPGRGTACRGQVAPQYASLGWWAYRGVERPNATRGATHTDMTAKKWQKLAIYRPRFTDIKSVFVDFAVRHRVGGDRQSRGERNRNADQPHEIPSTLGCIRSSIPISGPSKTANNIL